MKKTFFGTTAKGDDAYLYTLSNENITIQVTDFGSTLVSLMVPDKNGTLTDICLGYDSLADYENDPNVNLGCNVGRNANRIRNSRFSINNVEYTLDANDGKNNLHSGFSPYSKRMWNVEEFSDDSITFSLFSPHMDQGFPGSLTLYVTYKLVDKGFKLIYSATPNMDTLINVTNHCYFNLNGEGCGNVLDHMLTVNSDTFTYNDTESIPTGEIYSVKGTPMDFRITKAVGKDINVDYDTLKSAKGYDHNWCINQTDFYDNLAKAIDIHSTKTGIQMTMYTDYPGIQIYSGNYTDVKNGKHGHTYSEKEAICFEPQFYPDSINIASFPSPICKANNEYHKEISYIFDII